MLEESTRLPSEATFCETVRAGDYFIRTIRSGSTVRIVDVEGNEAADTLFYNAADPSERYSATDTIRAQGNVYLSTGTTHPSQGRTSAPRRNCLTYGRHCRTLLTHAAPRQGQPLLSPPWLCAHRQRTKWSASAL